MKSILSAALAGTLLLACAPGCRSDANRELLERELRDHEDEIYSLQQEVEDAHHQLEACQRENASLKGGGAAVEPGAPVPPRTTPRPTDDIPPIPKIDLGTPDSSPPPPNRKPRETPEQGRSDSARARPAAHFTDPPGPVERVAINRLMSGGHSFSGTAADDGLFVVFAARDASGRPVQAIGDISIVVIDPEAPGETARLARWDFAAPEAAAHYRQGSLGDAFHFELLWPNQPPQHRELKLFVRLTGGDGRRFEDSQTIRVRLPGDTAAATAGDWTKPGASRQWEPATMPSGAQFDPGPKPVAEQEVAEAPAEKPAPMANDTDGDSKPKASARRPSWSPFR